jgi:hypothetical protein
MRTLLLLLPHFPLVGGGTSPSPEAAPRRRHATASWAYFFRLIKLLPSSPHPAKVIEVMEAKPRLLWVDFGSSRRLHATAFRPSARPR